MSGYSDVPAQDRVRDESVPLIQKPFAPEELAGKVRGVLGSSAPA